MRVVCSLLLLTANLLWWWLPQTTQLTTLVGFVRDLSNQQEAMPELPHAPTGAIEAPARAVLTMILAWRQALCLRLSLTLRSYAKAEQDRRQRYRP